MMQEIFGCHILQKYIYSKRRAYEHTDRQTQLVYYVSTWGQVRLAPVRKQCTCGMRCGVWYPCCQWGWAIPY